MTTKELLEKLDFKKGNGLIPVVVQDAKTKETLMLAYANKEAVELTFKTKKSHVLEPQSKRTLGERRNLRAHTKNHLCNNRLRLRRPIVRGRADG